MSTYKERLKSEIERIGENISKLSKELGVARNTLYNWAEKSNIPLDKLMALSEKGLDVEYVVLGEKKEANNPAPTEQERLLLEGFRSLDDEYKQAALRIALGGIAGFHNTPVINSFNGTIFNSFNGK